MNRDKKTKNPVLGEFKDELFLSPNITKDFINKLLHEFVEPQTSSLDDKSCQKLLKLIMFPLIETIELTIQDLIVRNLQQDLYLRLKYHRPNDLRDGIRQLLIPF